MNKGGEHEDYDADDDPFEQKLRGRRPQEERHRTRRVVDLLRIPGESAVEKGLMLVLSTFIVLTTTGSVYGWSPLLLILQENGVYSELCPPSEQTAAASAPPPSSPITPGLTCEEQDLRLNLIYTSAVMSLGLTTIVYGVMVDWLGPRVVLPVSAVCFGLGCLLFAFSNSDFDMYIVGFVGIAAGGCGAFYGVIRLSELFGSQKVTVMGIYSVAFDASTVVFPLYELAYRATGFSIQSFFILYSSIALLLLATAIIWPMSLAKDNKIQTPPQQLEDEEENLRLPSKSASDEALPLLGKGDVGYPAKPPVRELPMIERPFKDQIRSIDYWCYAAYLTISVLWLNMYVGTVPNQIERLTDDRATVDMYVEVFSWVLPAVFIIGPLIGWGVNRMGMVWSIIVTHALALAFAALKLVPILELQLLTFVVASVYRAFFYTALIGILISLFGYANFGKAWGICIFIAGWTNYLQQPLLQLAYELGSFYYISVAQLATLLLFTAYPLYFWHRLPILTQ